MHIYDHPLLNKDVEDIAVMNLPWERLKNKSILISGGTGLIGTFLIYVLMKRNIENAMNCKIYAIGRSKEKAERCFSRFFEHDLFDFTVHDMNNPMDDLPLGNIDYAIHLASNTHPIDYAQKPIETITTNIIGLKNILDFCVNKSVQRFAFASSNEIYGENRGDVEVFDEAYCGFINCNTLRAGYPESKRCGEALCQAYINQKGLDIVIPRFTRSYGATMQMGDSKAISQFIKKGIQGEDIVLKSKGNQYYSFTYVADAVSGLLTILLCGKKGEAYNISDEKSDIYLKDLAKIIADECGRKVVFELPNELERIGFSKATKARLNNKKLKELGWEAIFDINRGVGNTIKVLKDVRGGNG